jgi:hypothetical protein
MLSLLLNFVIFSMSSAIEIVKTLTNVIKPADLIALVQAIETDLSNIKAEHQQELERLNVQHEKELGNLRLEHSKELSGINSELMLSLRESSVNGCRFMLERVAKAVKTRHNEGEKGTVPNTRRTKGGGEEVVAAACAVKFTNNSTTSSLLEHLTKCPLMSNRCQLLIKIYRIHCQSRKVRCAAEKDVRNAVDIDTFLPSQFLR